MPCVSIARPCVQDIAAESVRVYRQLLRATTYLPDSFARTYIHNHIVSRTKQNSNTNRLINRDGSFVREGSQKRKLVIKRLKDARADATVLERAGRGSIDDLKKVLLLVHGRKGKRKRELIRDLLRDGENSTPSDSRALEELYHGSEKQAVEFVPGPKFERFLKSQQSNPPLEHPKYKIKHLSPIIPDQNLWARPMPHKRVANLRRRWWAYTLDKLVPPVPRAEWDRLKALATGLQGQTLRPRRISVPCLCAEPESAKKQDALGELMEPIRQTYAHLDSFGFDSDRKVLTSTEKESPEETLNKLTPRSLQRLYASIWNMTATMSQNPETREWDVEWGGQRSKALNGEFTQASQTDKELFTAPKSLERPKRKLDDFRKKLKSGRSLPKDPNEKQTSMKSNEVS